MRFFECLQVNHPTFLLYHVARCNGGRFDLILGYLAPMHVHCSVTVDHIDYYLGILGKKKGYISIFDLWTLFTFPEMVV